MPKVTVYSTPTCPFCIRAKNFLTQNKIQFDNKNVAEDRLAGREMIRKSGQMGVPVIDIDGQIIIGFDENKIKQLLKI